MRAVRQMLLVAACLAVAHSAWAQATLAGTVKDASGAVLPGVTVEAASPALIEKVRTTVDRRRRTIPDRRSPAGHVHHDLHAGRLRDGQARRPHRQRLGGHRRGRRHARRRCAGDDHRHRRDAGRRHQSTKREITLDNETLRSLPSVRSYSYLLSTVPGLQTNNNNVNTGPVFAIFPIHGGRGVESRLTVDGLNISNPPGGNQPPNFTADVGNAQEVTMLTSGGLGEIGDRGPDDEHRAEAGRQQFLGPGVRLRLLGGDAVGQLHHRAEGAWRHACRRPSTASTTSTRRPAVRS